jgi:hypothetical protein
VIDRASHLLLAVGVLVKEMLTGPAPLPLYLILVGLELWMLYGLFHARGASVIVFSHLRFILSVFVLSPMTVLYWRGSLLLLGDGWIRYAVFCIGVFLSSSFIMTGLQQTILMMIKGLGKAPIVKDLEREEFSGNDCHYSVIRRWAMFEMVWFVIIPGLIVTMPSNMTVVSVLLLPWLLVALSIVLRTSTYWI